MKRLLPVLSFLVLALFATSPFARQVNIPAGNPVVGIDIPNGWKTSATSRGIEVRSPDEEVFFWVEVYLPAQYDALVKEHETYFKGQGVVITGEANVSSSDEGGVKIQATNLPATWKGKKTILRYLAIDPNLPARNQVLLSYWASPEGDKKHDPAFQKVLESLGAPK